GVCKRIAIALGGNFRAATTGRHDLYRTHAEVHCAFDVLPFTDGALYGDPDHFEFSQGQRFDRFDNGKCTFGCRRCGPNGHRQFLCVSDHRYDLVDRDPITGRAASSDQNSSLFERSSAKLETVRRSGYLELSSVGWDRHHYLWDRFSSYKRFMDASRSCRDDGKPQGHGSSSAFQGLGEKISGNLHRCSTTNIFDTVFVGGPYRLRHQNHVYARTL